MSFRRPSPRVLALAVCGLAGLLAAVVVALAVLIVLDASFDDDPLASGLVDAITALAFAVVGAIVTTKRPDNLVGWALALAGVGLLFGEALGAYAELALIRKPELELPGGTVAGAIDAGSWTPMMAGVFLLFVVFPAGRIPPRWRRVAPIVLIGFALIWLAISTAPGELEPPLGAYENPLAITSSKYYIVVLIPVIAACLVSLALAGIGLVMRFRRSRGAERQQFKWLAASAGLLVVTLPVAAAFNYSGVVGAFMSVALTALPVSVGIAVLRYRLYDIDRVISRTLVYGSLTVVLGAAYVGLVLAGQALFSSFAGGSDLAIAASTLVVAGLFLPARSRVQRFVDRRFYRRRYDAQRTLEAFGARLREQIDLETLQSDRRAVVHETMQPSHASLWVRTGADA
jgi:hypothetical protein